MTELVFYFFASTAIISALFILITKHVLHAALALVVILLSVAALYVFAQAEFVAVTQIMIYVGGIVVLIVFGVMLTNDISGRINMKSLNRLSGGLIALVLFTLLIYGVQYLPMGVSGQKGAIPMEVLGELLLTTYLLPFEIAAVLLLLALIAAAVIAGHNLRSEKI